MAAANSDDVVPVETPLRKASRRLAVASVLLAMVAAAVHTRVVWGPTLDTTASVAAGVPYSRQRPPELQELAGRGAGSAAAASQAVGVEQKVREVRLVDLHGLEVPGMLRQEHLSPGARFCNASAPLPPTRPTPRSFNLTAEWQERCEAPKDHPEGAASYKARNWCWAWMKYEGCLWTHGHWSWWEAQERLAKQGRAPDPHVLPFHPILNPQLCERPVLGNGGLFTRAEDLVARRWVAENVAVYVLNLPSDVERWERMVSRLELLGLTAERVFGVDLTEPGALQQVREEDLLPATYDVSAAERAARAGEMGGITGTVGVASAHFRALGRAYERRGHKPLALILEDDTELVEDFAIRLWRLLSEAPCDWAAISLKSRCAFGECVTPHLTRVRPDGNEPDYRCHHGVNYGFYAMLYRSSSLDLVQRKLREKVWQESRPHCLDVDVALASISEEVPYYAVPAVQQPGFLHEGSQGSARYTKNSIRLSEVPALTAH